MWKKPYSKPDHHWQCFNLEHNQFQVVMHSKTVFELPNQWNKYYYWIYSAWDKWILIFVLCFYWICSGLQHMFTKHMELEVHVIDIEYHIQWHVLHTPVFMTRHIKYIFGENLLQAAPQLCDVKLEKKHFILIEAALVLHNLH